ncbi:MAG: glycoside hydrolase family 15 protein [Flavobacteriales bacterium]|nr:glycoside hydrolase family 15 protein [Flavobacteriales bacterium]MBK9194672.1 glycoside hydrolase family 15 protein [Flavobacteriales bacterium]
MKEAHISAQGFPPIADHGVIGNCHTAALITSRGSMDWLCWPRFDSPSLFARILDLEKGGQWAIHPEDAFHSSHEYLPNTNVLATTFTCDGGRVRLLDAMNIANTERVYGTPHAGYVLRIVEGLDGEVPMVSACSPRLDYGRVEPVFRIDGQEVHFGAQVVSGPSEWRLDEQQGTALCNFRVCAGERVAFVLRNDHAPSTADPFHALEDVITYWRDWSALCTYQGPYRIQVVRSCLALKLLQDATTGAIVAAPTTSLPEEIGGVRNWDYRFSWLRDASFTLYALLLAGYVKEDDAFFDWIIRTVKLEGTGLRVLYPIDPSVDVQEKTLGHFGGYRGSRPVRIGNGAADQIQLDVYGEVLDALAFACHVSEYDPGPVWKHFRPIVDWVAANWDQPENGIWEVRGGRRHFVFGKVMCWVALDRAINLAEQFDLAGDREKWSEERDRIKAQVMERGWSERLGAFKQSYEDERLDAANLLLSMVGFIDGTDPRMVSTIDATLDRLVQNGLCYRYLDAPDGIEGGEATFALCTFWLVDALILADRADEAHRLFDGILARATGLGLFAEEIDPITNAHLGNFPQAFSHIGVINAAVSLAHVGQTGKVDPRKAAAARKAYSGGGGAAGGHST